jgi:CRISPR-associated protein Csx3
VSTRCRRGAWYQESVRNNPELAARLKAEYKAKFTWPFAERVAESVRLCEQPLTLIDVGGVVDEKNEWIARHASHAVLIAAQAQDLVSRTSGTVASATTRHRRRKSVNERL